MYFIYFILSYIDFFIYLIISIGISCLLIGIAYFFTISNFYFEKTIGYECGFDPFSEAREPFNIKFYLISIIFLIFDVETLYFFPWIISINYINIIGFYIMYIFFIILSFGYLYEYKKNILEW